MLKLRSGLHSGRRKACELMKIASSQADKCEQNPWNTKVHFQVTSQTLLYGFRRELPTKEGSTPLRVLPSTEKTSTLYMSYRKYAGIFFSEFSRETVQSKAATIFAMLPDLERKSGKSIYHRLAHSRHPASALHVPGLHFTG